MPIAAPAPGFLVACMNPVIQKTLVFDRYTADEVNRCAEHRVDASGKGVNVARVLAQTGRRAVQLTQAGGNTRDWFLSLCAQDGLEMAWVESGSEIRFCYTVIDRSAGTATELVEEGRQVAPGTAELLLAELDRLLPSCGTLIVSGTKAAGFPDSLVPEMVRRAIAAGHLVVLDIKGTDLLASLQHRPAVVKPNLHELLATWPLAGTAALGRADNGQPQEGALRAHVETLAGRLHAGHGSSLVVTRGHRPTWYWDDGALREEPVTERAAVNPTGSGDSFTAGLAAVLAEGGTMRDAVREGSRLGGLNAERLKPGSVI